jgi:DNA primase
MRFSPEFIERVREANDLVDLVGEYSSLKRTGSQFTGLCPLPSHKEKSPSFSVSQEKQLYHCFGCGKSGNVITFVIETKGLDFVDTVKYLANRAAIELPKDRDRASEEEYDESKALFHVNMIALEFFCAQQISLPDNHEVALYIKSRGLTPLQIEQFKIGYAPKDGNALLKHFETNNVPVQLGIQLGLLKSKDGKVYDAYRHRVMFPIISAQGRVLGFGGRSILPEQMPKYINSSDSKIFSKGKVLYGLHETAKYIRSEDAVFLVEGYMDLLALYNNGVQNVCATLGTALTEEHAKLMRKHTKNVYLTFDGDSAGQAASVKSLPILLSHGLFPKIIQLNDAKDPDEFFKKHKLADWKKLAAEAEDLVIWRFRQFPLGSFGSSTSSESAQKMAEIIRLVGDRSYRQSLEDFASKRLQVDAALLKNIIESVQGGASLAGNNSNALQTNFRAPNTQNPLKKPVLQPSVKLTENRYQGVLKSEDVVAAPKASTKVALAGASKQEVMLLQAAIMSEKVFLRVMDEQLLPKLSHEGIKKAFEMMNDAYRQMPNKFASLASHLASYVEPSSIIGALFKPEWKNLNEDQLDRLMADCVRKIHEQHLKNLSRSKLAEMRTSSRNQQLKELEQFMNIQESLKSNSSKNTASE